MPLLARLHFSTSTVPQAAQRSTKESEMEDGKLEVQGAEEMGRQQDRQTAGQAGGQEWEAKQRGESSAICLPCSYNCSAINRFRGHFLAVLLEKQVFTETSKVRNNRSCQTLFFPELNAE